MARRGAASPGVRFLTYVRNLLAELPSFFQRSWKYSWNKKEGRKGKLAGEEGGWGEGNGDGTCSHNKMGNETNFNRTVIKWMKERGSRLTFSLKPCTPTTPSPPIDYTSHLINGTQIYKRFDDRWNALGINTTYTTAELWNSWRSERYIRYPFRGDSRKPNPRNESRNLVPPLCVT